MKFTFKTEKPTGSYRSFYPEHHYVKLKKKTVGMIGDKHPHYIRLKVIKANIMEDGNSNCDWKWITLANQFRTIQEEKIFLNENIKLIMKQLNLSLED